MMDLWNSKINKDFKPKEPTPGAIVGCGVMSGVLTSIFSRMVAPSLVMMTSPSGETSILSIPLGPREVLRRLATVLAARMLI